MGLGNTAKETAEHGILGIYHRSKGSIKENIGKTIYNGAEKAEKVANAMKSPLARKIGIGAAITAGLGATAYGIHSAYDYLDKKF